MTRTERNRATIFVLAFWILLAAFAAAAFAQQRVADAPSLSNDVRDIVESGRDRGNDPCSLTAPGATVMAVDLSTLPSLDSIGARSDVAVFMQSGVPAELQVAALRRAWVLDPAIRDYKGLQENDWDFEAGNGIPGFGELGPDADVQWMLAGLFSQPPRQATRAPALSRAFYDPITRLLAILIQRPGRDAARGFAQPTRQANLCCGS